MIFGTSLLQLRFEQSINTAIVQVEATNGIYGGQVAIRGITTITPNLRTASIGNNHYSLSYNFLNTYGISDAQLVYRIGASVSDATVHGIGDIHAGSSSLTLFLPSNAGTQIYIKTVTGTTNISSASLIFTGSSQIGFIRAGSSDSVFYGESAGSTTINNAFFYQFYAIKELYNTGSTWRNRSIGTRAYPLIDLTVTKSGSISEIITLERDTSEPRAQYIDSTLVENGVIYSEKNIGIVSDSIISNFTTVIGSTIKMFALGSVDSDYTFNYAISSRVTLFKKQNNSWDLGVKIPLVDPATQFGAWDYNSRMFFMNHAYDGSSGSTPIAFFLEHGRSIIDVTPYLQSYSFNNYMANITLGNYGE